MSDCYNCYLMYRDNKPKRDQLTVASVRNKFKASVRQQALESLFRGIRYSLLDSINHKVINQPVNIPWQLPVLLPQQLPPQTINLLLQQYVSNYLLPYYQVPLPTVPVLPLPPPEPIVPQPQIELNPEPIDFPPREAPARKEYEPPTYFQNERYRVYDKMIGQGAFSKVWQGVDMQTGQKIAAKQIKKLSQGQSKCLKSLHSPHITKIHSIIRQKRSTFIILQLCEKNLRQELADCDFNLGRVLDIFQQMVKGMDMLQSHNFIHRDLKFENILIAGGVVKIADFGLAKYIGDQMEIQSRRCGTPYTMAPQIFFSKEPLTSYTIKCDIWSIGILLHQMLYQTHPFNSSKTDFKKNKRVKTKRKFGILDKIIEGCLIFNPDRRISWEEFSQLFREFQQNKARYLEIDVLPIEAQSIVYQQEYSKKSEEERMRAAFKKKVPNKREKELERKSRNDYNAESKNKVGIRGDSGRRAREKGQYEIIKQEQNYKIKLVDRKQKLLNKNRKIDNENHHARRLREMREYQEEIKRREVNKREQPFSNAVQKIQLKQRILNKRQRGRDLGELFGSKKYHHHQQFINEDEPPKPKPEFKPFEAPIVPTRVYNYYGAQRQKQSSTTFRIFSELVVFMVVLCIIIWLLCVL